MLYSEEINTFLAVVRCGSLIQAAEIVCATQSTVSYRLQSLERRFGKRLILRSRGSRGIVLTPDGERFVELAERWKALEREATVFRGDSDRYLAVGAADTAALHLLPPFIEALSANARSYRLHVESGRYWTLQRRVVSGRLHVAFTFVAASHADLQSVPVASYAMRIVYRPNGKPDARRTVSVSDFDVDDEVYVPYSTDIDIWREARGLSRTTDNVDKVHLLAPLLNRPGRWALVPSFISKTLASIAGCRTASLREAPPALVLYQTVRRSRTPLAPGDREAIDAALSALPR